MNRLSSRFFLLSSFLLLTACERPFVAERPPEIAEVTPDLSVVREDNSLALSLRVVSFRQVARVEVNGVPLASSGANWQGTLPLAFGLNRLVVEMEDAEGIVGHHTLFAVHLPLHFTEAPPLPQPRGGHIGISLRDGQVLVAGGAPSRTAQARPEAFVFSPTAQAWRVVGPLRQARTAHAAALLPDGHVLLTGGSRSEMLDPASFISTVEIFDPATEQFSEIPVAGEPIRRAQHTMGAFEIPSGPDAGLYVFVYGGRGPTGSATNPIGIGRDQRAFVLRNDTLHALPFGTEYLEPFAGHTQTLLYPASPGADAEYLIAGSYFASPQQVDNRSFRLLFSERSGLVFRQAPGLFAPRTRHAAARIAPGLVVLTGGHGFTPGEIIGALEVFAAEPERFFRFSPDLHEKTWGHAATITGTNRILLTGGFYIDGTATSSARLLAENEQLP